MKHTMQYWRGEEMNKQAKTSFLFIYGLHYNTVNSSDYMESNDRMINEMERMWKEAVVS
jgi:hypothetical protein